MFLVYVDDAIFISPKNDHIKEELALLHNIFNISVEGDLSNYVGVNIERTKDGTIYMTQPQLINSVLKELNFTVDSKEAPQQVMVKHPTQLMGHTDV
jgi:hypothetical protein